MKKIRFGVIGTGWRAAFFLRIAKALPEQFEVTNLMSRSVEKAEAYAKEWDIQAVTTVEEVLAAKPDYVILSVSKVATEGYLQTLCEAGMPVLCETPPATTYEGLYRIWDTVQKNNAKVQVAEQYHKWPLYTAIDQIVAKQYLGEISNMRMSTVHGYHAASIFRRVLGVGMKGLTVQGERFTFPVVETDSRYGVVTTREMGKADRDIITLKWEDGKVAFYDFSNKQYHSDIRVRSMNIQGDNGEFENNTLRYVNEAGITVTVPLVRTDRGVQNISDFSHQHMALGGEILFDNPYPGLRFNDDEIAIASCMIGMQRYIETGEHACYSLADAMQDAAISIAMEEAVTQGKTVTLGAQPWENAL